MGTRCRIIIFLRKQLLFRAAGQELLSGRKKPSFTRTHTLASLAEFQKLTHPTLSLQKFVYICRSVIYLFTYSLDWSRKTAVSRAFPKQRNVLEILL